MRITQMSPSLNIMNYDTYACMSQLTTIPNKYIDNKYYDNI